MRSIELYNKTWECECGRMASVKVEKCRGCGKPQPVYGIIEKKETRRDKTEEKLFSSTLGEENKRRHGLK